MIFDDRLSMLRAKRGLTQEQAAKAMGVPGRSYQRFEMDGRKTHYDTLIKMADFCEVSVDWLMGRTDKREVNW